MRQRNRWFINFIEEGNSAPFCRATATSRQEYLCGKVAVAYKKASDGKKFCMGATQCCFRYSPCRVAYRKSPSLKTSMSHHADSSCYDFQFQPCISAPLSLTGIDAIRFVIYGALDGGGAACGDVMNMRRASRLSARCR